MCLLEKEATKQKAMLTGGKPKSLTRTIKENYSLNLGFLGVVSFLLCKIYFGPWPYFITTARLAEARLKVFIKA